MSDPFLDPILERIAQAQASSMRIGTVTAIDAPDGSLAVALAGGEVTGVRWVGSYSPTVNDVVVVSQVSTMWVVLGKLSKQLGGSPVVYESVTVLPWATYRGVNAGASSSPGSWTWTPAEWVGFAGQRGGGGVALESGMAVYPIAGSVPPGATVTRATLTLARGASVMDDGPMLVSPALYGTAFFPGPGGSVPAGAPSWVATFGPWRPGTVLLGTAARWDLPSAWVTALLAGTLTGVGVWTEAAADSAAWTTEGLSWSLQFDYTLPA